MEKVLIFLTLFLVTINVNVKSCGHEQQMTEYANDVEENILSNRKRIKRKANDRNKMYYPDEFYRLHKMPSKNCSFGLCEEIDDYPSEKIQKILNRSLEYQAYFANQPPIFEIYNRFGEEGENLCETRVHTVFPKSAMNTRGVEQILVNVGEYKQAVSFETCSNADGPCKYSEVFPNGYTTSCQQKFTVRKLLAIGKDSEQPIFDNFQMPSCCICIIKKN